MPLARRVLLVGEQSPRDGDPFSMATDFGKRLRSLVDVVDKDFDRTFELHNLFHPDETWSNLEAQARAQRVLNLAASYPMRIIALGRRVGEVFKVRGGWCEWSQHDAHPAAVVPHPVLVATIPYPSVTSRAANNPQTKMLVRRFLQDLVAQMRSGKLIA